MMEKFGETAEQHVCEDVKQGHPILRPVHSRLSEHAIATAASLGFPAGLHVGSVLSAQMCKSDLVYV